MKATLQNPYRRHQRPSPGIAAAAPASQEHDANERPLVVVGRKEERKEESASALVMAACDKAGMEGIDRKRIDAIILRESGDSLYMRQQRRRDQQVNARISGLRDKMAQAVPGWEREIHRQLEAEMSAVRAQRPSRSYTVVVDMDAFYMACELLSRPALRKRPACVGRGMILTSNYTARAYGVRSAMAGWIGCKLVEELSEGKETLIQVPSNFHLYKEKSAIVQQVLAEYDPHLKAYSLDEAYMNIGPYLALKLTKGWDHERIAKALGERKDDQTLNQAAGKDFQVTLAMFSPSTCLEAGRQVLTAMRQAVCVATGGLTCSAGLAPNFLLAKIASDRNKPDGQCLVGPDHKGDVLSFLYPLPVRKVSGIGRVTEKILQAFGVQTVQDLYEKRALVRYIFKPATAGFLWRASLGCSSGDGEKDDDNEEETDTAGRKGISRERTFTSGKTWAETNAKLEEIAHLLAADMTGKDLWARTITVKVKLHTFDVLSRSKSLASGVYVREPAHLMALALELLRGIRHDFTGNQFSARLLGIRCSNFRTEEDDATGTFRVQDYFRGSPPSSKRALVGQRSLDFFFKESTVQDESGVAGKDKDAAGDTGLVDPFDDPVDPAGPVCCPVCQQASFGANEIAALNRHLDRCLAPPTPAKPAKKRRLKDFWGQP